MTILFSDGIIIDSFLDSLIWCSAVFSLQELFKTTYGTLAAAGESFFTSLLSGRHKNTTDESGALFIDSQSLLPSHQLFHWAYNMEIWNIETIQKKPLDLQIFKLVRKKRLTCKKKIFNFIFPVFI